MIQIVSAPPSDLFEKPRMKRTVLPFTKLNVGEGFFVPSNVATRTSVSVGASRNGARLGKTFATSSVTGGVWVKRVA